MNILTSFVALTVALGAQLTEEPLIIMSAILLSGSLALYLMIRQAYIWWTKGHQLAELFFVLSVVFWFVIGSLKLVITRPLFENQIPAYPFFGSVIPLDIIKTAYLQVYIFLFAGIIGSIYIKVPRKAIQSMVHRRQRLSGGLTDSLLLLVVFSAISAKLITYGWDFKSLAWDILAMRGGEKQGATDTAGLLKYIYFFGVISGSIALAKMVHRIEGYKIIQLLTFLLMLPFVFGGHGSRFNLGFYLLPTLILFLRSTPNVRHYWRSQRRRLVFGLAALLVVILFQGAVRTIGLPAYIHSAREGAEVNLGAGLFGFDHFSSLMVSVDVVGHNRGFFFEPLAPHFFYHWVPRSLWPGKPKINSWEFFNYIWTQGRAFNVTPSIIGQYYYNWGMVGVIFIGLFMGWLWKIGIHWLNACQLPDGLLAAQTAALFLAFLFLSCRFLSPLYFTFPFFAYLGYIILTYRVVTK